MAQLDVQSFQALLQGLTRRAFYDESPHSAETEIDALQQLWGDGVQEDVWRADMQTVEAVLLGAAQNHWDVAKLEEVLRSMSLLSAESILVFCAFWGQEREKVHQLLVKRSTWNGHFKKLSWRVDVKSVGKSGADLTEPVALFELRTQDGQQVAVAGGGNTGEVCRRQVQFEMSREDVANMLAELDKVQAAIAAASTY